MEWIFGLSGHYTSRLMIVHYLHLKGTAALPSKDQAPLVIDPDRVKSGPVAFEEFQSIPWRRPKIAEFRCVVQVQQLAARDSAQLRRKRSHRPGSLVVEQVLCQCASEAFDHVLILSEFDNLSMSPLPWMPLPRRRRTQRRNATDTRIGFAPKARQDDLRFPWAANLTRTLKMRLAQTPHGRHRRCGCPDAHMLYCTNRMTTR